MSNNSGAQGRALVGLVGSCLLALLVIIATTRMDDEHGVVEERASRQRLYILRAGMYLGQKEEPHTAAARLRAAKFKVHHMHHDVVEVVAPKSRRQQLLGMGMKLVQEMDDGGFARARHAKGYHNPAQLHAAFKSLERKHRGYAKLYSLTHLYKTPKTHEGREIYAMKISDNVELDEADEPNVLFVSNHHARELIVPELALHTATQLLQGVHHGDAATKKVVHGNQIYIVYTMNPDGLNAVWKTNLWQRKNARGVDLNRNYPIGFSASCGGSGDKKSETYRGPNPFSEAETQTMKAFQRDRNFAKLIDFHSYARQVRINYGSCARLPRTITALFAKHGRSVAKKMGYQQSQSCCMGGDIHFAYNKHGTLAFLIETGEAFQPKAAEMRREVSKVYPGIVQMLQIPISLSGQVIDRNTKKPIKASLTVPRLRFKLNEQSTTSKSGHYHLWLPEGKHVVVVSADGYPDRSFEVEASDNGNMQNLLTWPQTKKEAEEADSERMLNKFMSLGRKKQRPRRRQKFVRDERVPRWAQSSSDEDS